MSTVVRPLLVVLMAAMLFLSTGCTGSQAPKKTKDQPPEMDMDNVPPVKP